MPYKNNYGYWSDNSLTYSDFKNRLVYYPLMKVYLIKNGRR